MFFVSRFGGGRQTPDNKLTKWWITDTTDGKAELCDYNQICKYIQMGVIINGVEPIYNADCTIMGLYVQCWVDPKAIDTVKRKALLGYSYIVDSGNGLSYFVPESDQYELEIPLYKFCSCVRDFAFRGLDKTYTLVFSDNCYKISKRAFKLCAMMHIVFDVRKVTDVKKAYSVYLVANHVCLLPCASTVGVLDSPDRMEIFYDILALRRELHLGTPRQYSISDMIDKREEVYCILYKDVMLKALKSEPVVKFERCKTSYKLSELLVKTPKWKGHKRIIQALEFNARNDVFCLKNGNKNTEIGNCIRYVISGGSNPEVLQAFDLWYNRVRAIAQEVEK